MSLPPLSPSGPGGLLHNYGINYNMLETILPNYGLIRRILSRKVGIDISSILGVAFIGYTLSQTCATVWRHGSQLASACATWITSTISLQENDSLARNVATWAAEHISSGNTRSLSASSIEGGEKSIGKSTVSSKVDQFDDATCKSYGLIRVYRTMSSQQAYFEPNSSFGVLRVFGLTSRTKLTGSCSTYYLSTIDGNQSLVLVSRQVL